jgi:hypothetical protein
MVLAPQAHGPKSSYAAQASIVAHLLERLAARGFEPLLYIIGARADFPHARPQIVRIHTETGAPVAHFPVSGEPYVGIVGRTPFFA